MKGGWPLFQLVIRTKPRFYPYLRLAPITMMEPSEAQQDVRERLAEVARLSAGKKGLDPDFGWPWGATYALALKGYRSPYTRPKRRLWEIELLRLLEEREPLEELLIPPI